jgi:hypothetical protein
VAHRLDTMEAQREWHAPVARRFVLSRDEAPSLRICSQHYWRASADCRIVEQVWFGLAWATGHGLRNETQRVEPPIENRSVTNAPRG